MSNMKFFFRIRESRKSIKNEFVNLKNVCHYISVISTWKIYGKYVL